MITDSRATPAFGAALGLPGLRREAGALLVITVPLAAAYIAEMAMNVSDTVIVGRLGSVELAAVGLTAGLYFSLLFICFGLVTMVGVMAAQAHGAGDRDGVTRAVRQGMWVALAVSVPAMALGWHMAPLLRLLGQEEQVVAQADRYIRPLVWCFLPYMWFTVLRNFVTALSRAGSITVITVASVGVNVVAVYLLVFGKLGLPALGVAGAGYGTSLVCWLMFLALAVHVVRAPFFRPYRVFSDPLRIEPAVIGEIVRLGLPVAGISAVEVAMFAGIQILMGWFGAAVLAANQIAYSFVNIVFMIPFSIGQAATIRVAQGVGAGSMEAARRAGWLGIAIGAAYTIVAGVLMWTLARPIATLYLDPQDPAYDAVLSLATVLLGLAGLFHVVDGTQVIAAGALRGLKDTRTPFLIGAIGYWVIGFCGGYVLAFPAGFGPLGLWWGMAAGLAVAALLLTVRFHARTRAMPRPAGEAACG